MKSLNPYCFSLIAVLTLVVSPARADYHYVSHDGTNEYPYTSWETAAHLIIEASGAADPYDTVFIAAGDYSELIYMPPEDTCLTFIGAGTDSTHLWTNEPTNLWLARDNTTVLDIWFEHQNTRACFGAYIGASLIVKRCKFTGGVGILGWGDSTIVENCEFYEGYGAVDYPFTEKLVFSNNIVHNTTVGGDVVLLGGCRIGMVENNIFVIDVYNENWVYQQSWFNDTLIIRNNYIDNFLEGILTWSSLIGSEISNNTIRNIYNDNMYFDIGIEGTDIRDSTDIAIYNNVITESGTGIAIYYDEITNDHFDLRYNSFWGNVHNDIFVNIWVNVDTVGNFNAYPMFISDTDPHLQAFSPLIDAGDPDILDVDGSRSDIGVFGGPGGSSYDYQDLPPAIADSLSASVDADTIFIGWRMNQEADFNYYRLYRDTVSGFEPSVFNLIAEPETSFYADIYTEIGDYYYRIAALDNQDNVSEYSEELAVILTDIEAVSGVETPEITAIQTNYPNPFNSQTTIVYRVANLGPTPAQINIDIYDVMGRKVRCLVDARMEVGTHRVIWDGKNDSDLECPSGVYFAGIVQWNIDYLKEHRKLVLVR